MRVLVLGGSGLVGSAFLELAAGRFDLHAPAHAELDVLDAAALTAAIERVQPEAVLNLAAWADVDGAEAQRGDTDGRVFALNARFPHALARQCEQTGVHLVHVSTDYVFDGTRADRPYLETDPPNPLSWYAQTKYAGERSVLDANPGACIVRIEMPFTARTARKSDFARLVERRLRVHEALVAVDDQRITPVLLEDAVAALAELLVQRAYGVVHVASTTWTTPYHYARGVAQRLQLDETLIHPQPFAEFAATRPAARPQHSWLDVSLFRQQCGTHTLRSVDEELDAWAQARQRNSVGGTQSATTLDSRWTRTSSR